MAVHLDGRQRAAVQAETMTFLAGGETVGKDPRHIFRGDTFAIIPDADFQESVIDDSHTEGHFP
ncbi:hypothetical protein D3C86_1873510 [compost metagenome]